ncbi:MAG: hypothetical protein ACSHWQ_04010 [Spongiibacteraceae bacterium]
MAIETLTAAPNRADNRATINSKQGALNASLEQWALDVDAAGDALEADSIEAENMALVSSSMPNYQGAWDSGSTYALGDTVTYSGNEYISKQGSNLNQTPSGGGGDAWWHSILIAEVSIGRSVQDLGTDSGTINLDLGTYSHFEITLDGDVAFTLSGYSTASRLKFSIAITNGEDYIITWPTEALINPDDLANNKIIDARSTAGPTEISGAGDSANGFKFVRDGVTAGSMMTGHDYSGDDAFRVTWTTPYDIEGGFSYNDKDVGANNSNSRDMIFDDTGDVMYVVDVNGNDVEEYSLSTSHQPSTSTYVAQALSLGFSCYSLFYNDDGTKVFFLVDAGASVTLERYSCSTAYDINTATDDSNTLDMDAEGLAQPWTADASDDGTLIMATCSTTDAAYFWELTTPWDLTSKNFLGRFDFSDDPRGITYVPESEGEGFIVTFLGNDSFSQYMTLVKYEFGDIYANGFLEFEQVSETKFAMVDFDEAAL